MGLSSIFEPASIAVIGASNDVNKWGGRILKNILSSFKGLVYAVNPKKETILGLNPYPSVLDIPGEVDLAMIALPAQYVLTVAQECGKKGVKGLIVVSAGFSEAGNEDREKDLLAIVEKYGMRMIGPNTLGIVNEPVSLNASVIGRLPEKGRISFITQSGTLGLAIAEWTIEMGLGLCKIISTGNKANVDDVDIISYLGDDPATEVIAMYAEGIKRGKEFIDAARNIKKPIIAIKTGRSKRGAKAVFSHTGSIAGSDEIFSAAFKQAGILRVDGIEDIFDAALAFSCQPLPRGNNVAILSNGGGAAIVATDECEKYGINIADLTEKTQHHIKEIVPEYASVSNPIDTAAAVSYKIYREVMEALLLDQNVDALIVIYVHSIMSNARQPAAAVAHMKQQTHKPILTCWLGGAGIEEGIEVLKINGLPNYSVPERAVKALDALIRQRGFLEKVKTSKSITEGG